MVANTKSHKLQRLQEELNAFKLAHPSATLTKSTRETTAPFPLAVRFAVSTPAEFSHYDVESIQLDVVVDVVEGDVGDTFSTRVRCSTSAFPSSLRERIAASLQASMGASDKSENVPIGLKGLFKHVEANFGTLIGSVPAVLETYLVDDPCTGRSVRRVAILKENIEVAIDVEAKPCVSPRKGKVETFERLHAEAAVLAKLHREEEVRCVSTGATYIKSQDEDRNRRIVEFLHERGVGASLKGLSSATHVLTVTAVPSAPKWMDIVPTDVNEVAPLPLRVRIFAGEGYPSPTSLLCRVQLVDDAGVVPAEFDRMLDVFETVLLLKALDGVAGAARSKEAAEISPTATPALGIVKDCLNHADQAMREARVMYEEAKARAAASPALPTSPRSPTKGEPSNNTAKYVAHLHNLQMDGIDAMSLHAFCLEVLCSKCHKTHVITRDSLDTRWTNVETACNTCHSDMSVAVQPRIIHTSCNTICIVATSGCKPLDFLPSCSFEVQCDCTATRVIHKQFHQGRWNEEQCRTCHVKNALSFERCVFQEVRSTAAAHGSCQRGKQHHASIPKLYEAEVPLNVGQPLPLTGTCSHYRHSHRWLRFPCCGRRFPCDLCHEQHTDGHEMKWAKSMVCGYCSLEQRVDSKCTGCSKKLSTSASNPNGRRTCFWWVLESSSPIIEPTPQLVGTLPLTHSLTASLTRTWHSLALDPGRVGRASAIRNDSAARTLTSIGTRKRRR